MKFTATVRVCYSVLLFGALVSVKTNSTAQITTSLITFQPDQSTDTDNNSSSVNVVGSSFESSLNGNGFQSSETESSSNLQPTYNLLEESSSKSRSASTKAGSSQLSNISGIFNEAAYSASVNASNGANATFGSSEGRINSGQQLRDFANSNSFDSPTNNSNPLGTLGNMAASLVSNSGSSNYIQSTSGTATGTKSYSTTPDLTFSGMSSGSLTGSDRGVRVGSPTNIRRNPIMAGSSFSLVGSRAGAPEPGTWAFMISGVLGGITLMMKKRIARKSN